MCAVSVLMAQTRRLEFRDRTLADVLAAIDDAYPDTNIHFVYNALEAIRIDTAYEADGAEAAVRGAIGQLPIRITSYRTHLFVEYQHAQPTWEPEGEESYPLFIKTRPLPNVDFDYHLPTYRLRPSLTTLTVAGTELSGVGTALDLLAYLPGLMIDDPSVIFYVDGIPVSALSELAAWDAEAIRCIDYSVNDRNVPHTTKSRVVNIQTLRHSAGRGMQGQLQSRVSQGRGSGFNQSATADVHREKYDLLTRLGYERMGVYGDMLVNSTAWLERYAAHTLDFSAGMNIRLTDHHGIGFKYQYMDVLNKIRKTSDEVMMGSFDPDDVSGFENRRSTWVLDYAPRHDLNLYYRGDVGRWQLRTGANFYQDGVRLTDDYSLTTPNLQRNIISNTLWAVMAEAERPLGKGRVSVGAEYAFTRREDRYLQQSSFNEVRKIREQSRYSARASYAYPLSAFTAEAGLRYEYIDALISLDRHFFPFIALSFDGGGLHVNASYALHSVMPTYGQTNSFAYNNLEMLTVSGNPYLRPSLSRQTSLQAQYGKFYLTGNLQYVTDYVAQRIGIYAAGYFLNYQNVRKATLADLTLLYSDVIGPWQTQASATLLSQRLSCQYTDGVRTFNDPILQLVWHNQRRLPYAFSCMIDFSFNSSGHRGTVWQRHYTQLDAGVVKAVGRWTLQLKAADLLRMAKSQTISYGNNVKYYRSCYSDTKRLIFTAKYRFGKQKRSSRYEGVNAGKEEKERMK